MGSFATGLLILLSAVVQDDKAAEEAIERFKSTFNKATTADGRAGAVSELGRVPHEKTMKTLIPLAMGDPIPKVRAEAAKALGDFIDYKKAVTPVLIQVFAAPANTKELDVRCAAVTSLGKLKDPNAFDTIHRAFRDESAKVATAAITAAGNMRQKESMDPLLELLRDIAKWTKQKQSGGYRDDKGQLGDEGAYTGRLNGIQSTVLKAFQVITKEKWVTVQEWEIWWGRRKATWEVPK